MNKVIICTVCPRGCNIEIEGDGKKINLVKGYGCNRGLEYVNAEYICPVRILTTTVKIANVENDLLPVRSNRPLPKEKILQCMEIIKKASVTPPIKCNDVIIADICNTNTDIIATKTVL